MVLITSGSSFRLEMWQEVDMDGLYCPADDGVPEGPYTRQIGIWGYQEIMQAQNNETLINLPDAVPKSWKIVTDDCYQAPYMGNT